MDLEKIDVSELNRHLTELASITYKAIKENNLDWTVNIRFIEPVNLLNKIIPGSFKIGVGGVDGFCMGMYDDSFNVSAPIIKRVSEHIDLYDSILSRISKEYHERTGKECKFVLSEVHYPHLYPKQVIRTKLYGYR
jgi:hypothetical protein